MPAEGEADAVPLFDELFASYAAACRTGAEVDACADAAYEEGVERVKEHLLSSAGEAAACMICLESIRPTDPVWSCQGGCYCVMHLPCIQSWARRALAAAQDKAGQRLSPTLSPAAAAAAKQAAAWGCPKCRQECGTVPSAYHCWCGKQQDPGWEPWNAAHSCFCGAELADKRCGHHEFSCGGVSGAELPCGHTCGEVCHDGDCPPCPLISTVACRCGAEHAQLPCSQTGVFQCTRVCGKPLDCGRHHCEQVCHAGPCGGCRLAGPKACPCGKTQLPHAACDVVVPPCGETCGKLLRCGVHTCHERCHTGPCRTQCREVAVKHCECGKTEKRVQCQETFRCERRCTNMRGCGRHPCRRRCCDGVACPPCEEVCNKWLKCRNHRCPAPCHGGECAPCPLSARISCACGRSSYTVPCGRESAAKPPPCSHPCPVPALCRHAGTRPQHPCHFGPCPPCNQACGTQLPCGHTCATPGCHDPQPPAVPAYTPPPPPVAPTGPSVPGSSSSSSSSSSSKVQREAALQQAAAHALAAEARRLQATAPRTPDGALSACPACAVPVPVTCLGGHATVQQPCSAAAPFACEQTCSRPLACGNHACSVGCHDPQAQPCAPCTLPCQVPRRTCEHPCPLPCHPPGQGCPPCKLPISRACFCGKTTLGFVCHDATASQLPPQRLCCGKTCHRALPACPHTCSRECHPGACTSQGCAAEVTVRCPCKRRKEKLACSEVQHLLEVDTGSAAYDGGTSLRLLACDAACAQAAASPAKASSSGKEEAGPAVTEQPSTAAAAAEEQQPRRKLSREEKARLAEEKAAAKAAAEQRKRMLQWAALAAVATVAVLLAMAIRWLLTLADSKAREAWGHQDL